MFFRFFGVKKKVLCFGKGKKSFVHLIARSNPYVRVK